MNSLFTYQVVTKEEAERSRKSLLEPGEYEFAVINAISAMSNTNPKYADPSKPSNPMIVLELTVWDKEGHEISIKDYLVSSEKMNWKIIHFCESVGLMQEYETGKFNENYCKGKIGKLILGIQKGKIKDDGTMFDDKNSVKDYIKEFVTPLKSSILQPLKAANSNFKDDDLPF